MGSAQQNSDGNLRFVKTDCSSVFLNRFSRTVFAHFPVSPCKKFWDPKNRKFDLS